MIIVNKFRGRFRQRAPEWILAIGMLWWGLLTLAVPSLFEREFYYPLDLLMSQPFWGVAATMVGTIRLIALFINGLWRPTAHFRAITAIFSIFLWTSLLLASLSTGAVLGVPTFSMLLALDTMALWWAAGDARLADEVAKKHKGG